MDQIEARLVKLESQVGHLAEAIESERGSRRSSSDSLVRDIKDIETRVRSVERSIWIGFGAVMALQLFLGIE